ncbi:serine carboxypeptidase S28-domain-containing protein [Xylariaceae sp. FL0804]|nr:serine carboxypeptidase S28-domain-containing protein [Xylariaceae sp. FL0804]
MLGIHLLSLATLATAQYPTVRDMFDDSSDVVVEDFTQKINHTGGSTATFQQGYQLSTQYFRPGGPILFVQNGAQAMPPLEAVDVIDYAPKLNAIVAILEHRFFNSEYTMASMERNGSTQGQDLTSLTLDNVLQDGVDFVNWIRDTVPGANKSKILMLSTASYGGFLAVVARIRHPETFWGAIASSPALTSFGPLDVNSYRFAATDRASSIYYNASSEAAGLIQSAMLAFQQCVTMNSCATDMPDLKLCAPSSTDTETDTDADADDDAETDYAALYRAAAATYYNAAKYNYPYPGVFFPGANPLQDVIEQTQTLAAAASPATPPTPGGVVSVPLLLAASWAASSSSDSDSCIDPNNANLTSPPGSGGPGMAGVVGDNGAPAAYGYVRCAYYPVNDVSTSGDGMLPAAWARGSDAPVCTGPTSWFPPDASSANEYFVQKLGLEPPTLDGAGRLLIVQGGWDPTAAIGSPALAAAKAATTQHDDDDKLNLNRSRVVLVPGLAHAEDAVSEAVEPRGQKPQLDQMRDLKLEHMREWLGQGNQTLSRSSALFEKANSALGYGVLSIALMLLI